MGKFYLCMAGLHGGSDPYKACLLYVIPCKDSVSWEGDTWPPPYCPSQSASECIMSPEVIYNESNMQNFLLVWQVPKNASETI